MKRLADAWPSAAFFWPWFVSGYRGRGSTGWRALSGKGWAAWHCLARLEAARKLEAKTRSRNGFDPEHPRTPTSQNRPAHVAETPAVNEVDPLLFSFPVWVPAYQRGTS